MAKAKASKNTKRSFKQKPIKKSVPIPPNQLLNLSPFRQTLVLASPAKSDIEKIGISKKCITDFNNYLFGQNLREDSFEALKQQTEYILGGKSTPKNFHFRDKQIQQISTFIDEAFFPSSCVASNRMLLVIGSTGIGKSLTVSSVLETKNVKKICINANVMKSVRELQQMIGRQAGNFQGGREMKTDEIIRKLKKSTCFPTIISVDQIEMLLKDPPTHLTENFLSLFTTKQLPLVLLGTSNCIDNFPRQENYTAINRSRRIMFSSYSSEQLLGILTQKLKQIQEQTGIQIYLSQIVGKYAVKRLQKVSKGDIRIAVQFLKDVVIQTIDSSSSILTMYKIQLETVIYAFTKMNPQKIKLLTSLPAFQQMVLISLYLRLNKSQSLGASMPQLYSTVKWICNSLYLDYNQKMLDQSLQGLEQYSLIKVVGKKRAEGQVVPMIEMKAIKDELCNIGTFKRFLLEEDE